jgi:DNA gyrase subunit A
MNHHRGTQGQKIFRLTDKGSSIVNAVSVNEENDIVCVTLLGQTIRMHVKDISTQGRNASGVCVVTMKSKEDSIVALATTSYFDEEEENNEETEETITTSEE